MPTIPMDACTARRARRVENSRARLGRRRRRVVVPAASRSSSNTSLSSAGFIGLLSRAATADATPRQRQRLTKILQQREKVRMDAERETRFSFLAAPLQRPSCVQTTQLRQQGKKWLKQLHDQYPENTDLRIALAESMRSGSSLGKHRKGAKVVKLVDGRVTQEATCPDPEQVARETLEKWQRQEERTNLTKGCSYGNRRNAFRKRRVATTNRKTLESLSKSRQAMVEVEAGVLCAIESKS